MTTSIESLDAATSRVLVGGVEAFRFDTAGITGVGEGKLFGRKNVLGTVSQSAGVPTGAVIERGSNANGEYVRFADGTQICWGAFGASSVAANDITHFAWNYPASFVTSPNLSFAPGMPQVSEDVYGVVRTYTQELHYMELGYRNGATAQVINSIGITAVGRWF